MVRLRPEARLSWIAIAPLHPDPVPIVPEGYFVPPSATIGPFDQITGLLYHTVTPIARLLEVPPLPSSRSDRPSYFQGPTLSSSPI